MKPFVQAVGAHRPPTDERPRATYAEVRRRLELPDVPVMFILSRLAYFGRLARGAPDYIVALL